MNTRIVHVQHPALKAYIQYFIFFTHSTVDRFSYQTFPNTNLCLAIYKDNHIDYKQSARENLCKINPGRNAISSRLLGFHQQPFKVDITSALDQICILFHPGGLRAFTKAPYGELRNEPNVFECIFSNAQHVLEGIFDHTDAQERAALLEAFLIDRLLGVNKNHQNLLVLDQIYSSKGDVSVYGLSRTLKVNESTLYRNFTAAFGQAPKEFIQTVRFRNALSLLVDHQCKNLTELTYAATFYDQSHFIRDFKKRSGALPHSLHKNIRLEQAMLVWVVK